MSDSFKHIDDAFREKYQDLDVIGEVDHSLWANFEKGLSNAEAASGLSNAASSTAAKAVVKKTIIKSAGKFILLKWKSLALIGLIAGGTATIVNTIDAEENTSGAKQQNIELEASLLEDKNNGALKTSGADVTSNKVTKIETIETEAGDLDRSSELITTGQSEYQYLAPSAFSAVNANHNTLSSRTNGVYWSALDNTIGSAEPIDYSSARKLGESDLTRPLIQNNAEAQKINSLNGIQAEDSAMTFDAFRSKPTTNLSAKANRKSTEFNKVNRQGNAQINDQVEANTEKQQDEPINSRTPSNRNNLSSMASEAKEQQANSVFDKAAIQSKAAPGSEVVGFSSSNLESDSDMENPASKNRAQQGGRAPSDLSTVSNAAVLLEKKNAESTDIREKSAFSIQDEALNDLAFLPTLPMIKDSKNVENSEQKPIVGKAFRPTQAPPSLFSNMNVSFGLGMVNSFSNEKSGQKFSFAPRFELGYEHKLSFNWKLAGNIGYLRANKNELVQAETLEDRYVGITTVNRTNTLKSIDYLYVDVGARWVFYTKHSIYVGLNNAFVLQTKGDLEEVTTGGNNSLYEQKEVSGYREGLADYSIGLSLAYHRRLSKDLYLNLSTHQGVTDLTKNKTYQNDNKDRLHSYAITLKYFLFR